MTKARKSKNKEVYFQKYDIGEQEFEYKVFSNDEGINSAILNFENQKPRFMTLFLDYREIDSKTNYEGIAIQLLNLYNADKWEKLQEDNYLINIKLTREGKKEE